MLFSEDNGLERSEGFDGADRRREFSAVYFPLFLTSKRDVLSAFKVAEMPSAAEIQGGMERDIQRLASLQNASGGFGFWRLDEKEWPYLGIHVAMARATTPGVFVVPPPKAEEMYQPEVFGRGGTDQVVVK
jgi:uncharacterized protein YfaS (alpha-2-macroglobulin family)